MQTSEREPVLSPGNPIAPVIFAATLAWFANLAGLVTIIGAFAAGWGAVRALNRSGSA